MPKLIRTWEELRECKSPTHILEYDEYSAWILPKVEPDEMSWEGKHYLSTHTFYGMTHKWSTKVLQECGFDVEIDNWDKKTQPKNQKCKCGSGKKYKKCCMVKEKTNETMC